MRSEGSAPQEVLRVASELRRQGIDFVLLSTPGNVTYAAGFEAPIQLGPISDVVSGLPLALALVSADGAGQVVSADAYVKAAAQSWFAELTPYDSLGHFEELDPPGSLRSALRSMLQAAGLGNGSCVLGVEASLPRLVQELLAVEFPQVELRDAGPALEQARMIKTEREVGLLRRAAQVASAGQRRLCELAAGGATSGADIDLWIELLHTMESEASRQLIVTGELVTGSRTAHIAPGGPVGRELQHGDTVLFDVSPRVEGYWADCTNTLVFAAEPTAEQRKYFDAARESCEAAMATLVPGARCSDAAEAVRQTMERHGLRVAHYSGHEIGASVNERPRLAPYDRSIVEPGMVFCVEPGAYAGDEGATGARAEKTVLVTDDGPEILSQFEWGF